MDSISGISGNDYAAAIRQTQTNELENNISSLNKNGVKTASDAEMMEACKEFEAYMIEQVYKQMEKTIMKDEEEENEYEQYFGDMRIQQYASMASEQGTFGLAQQLYDAMKMQSQGIDPGTL